MKHTLPNVVDAGFHCFGRAAQPSRNVGLPMVLEGKQFQRLAQLGRQSGEGSVQARQPFGPRQGFLWSRANVEQVRSRHVTVANIVIRQGNHNGLAATGAQAIPREIDGDGVESGLKPRPRPEGMAVTIHSEEGVLEYLVRIRGAAEHSRQSFHQRALVPAHEPVKRLIIAAR